MMTLEQISSLGSKLATFLLMFSGCFKRSDAAALLHIYVKGQLSNIQRKTCEAIALRFRTAPRTLQRFLESIKWDEKRLRDTCQKIIARDHAHPQAIGTIDESGNTKSGKETAGVDRQYNGNRGKVDNCVVGVHLGYMAPGFQTLIDSQMYLTKDCIHDAARRKKTTFQTRLSFRRNSSWRFQASSGQYSMASLSWPGPLTSYMAAITSFSTVLKNLSNRLSEKFPLTSTAGRSSQKFAWFPEKQRKLAVANQNRKLSDQSAHPKFATCSSTHPPCVKSAGNVTTSRIPTRALKSGKSSGVHSGARVTANYRHRSNVSSSPEMSKLKRSNTSYPTSYLE